MQQHRILGGLLCLGWVGCAPPNPAEGFINLEQFVDEDGPSTNQRYVELMNAAEHDLRVALPAFSDVALATAFADAVDRGVDARLVIDYDSAEEEGVVALAERGIDCMLAEDTLAMRLEGMEPPCILADDGVQYFDFGNNVEVTVPSRAIQMTHAFAVADRVNIVRSNRAGDTLGGTRLTFVGQGEDLGDDLSWEHQQLHGGTDASTLTAFSSSAKSITDNRWMYPTQTPLVVEMWVGPQERVIKRVIDAIYRARSGVYVLTDDFVDVSVARALDQKAADGFNVQAIVGPRFGDTRPELSRTFYETANIQKYRVTDESVETVPTIVLVDWDADRVGGRPMTQAFLLTHDIASTSRYIGSGSTIEVLDQSDQLMDGNLFVLDAWGADADNSPEIGQITDVLLAYRDLAEEM